MEPEPIVQDPSKEQAAQAAARKKKKLAAAKATREKFLEEYEKNHAPRRRVTSQALLESIANRINRGP